MTACKINLESGIVWVEDTITQKHVTTQNKNVPINPFWTKPACASGALLEHPHLTEYIKKMGSLTQCPITFAFLHRSLPKLY